MFKLTKPYFSADNLFYLLLESGLVALSIWIPYALHLTGASIVRGGMVFGISRFLIVIAVIQTTFYYNGMYERRVFTKTELVAKVLFSLIISAGILTIIYYLVPHIKLPRIGFVSAIILCSVLLSAARLLQAHIFGQGMFSQRIIIIGTGHKALEAARLIDQKKLNGYTLLGVIESDEEWMNRQSTKKPPNIPLLTLMTRKDDEQSDETEDGEHDDFGKMEIPGKQTPCEKHEKADVKTLTNFLSQFFLLRTKGKARKTPDSF